MKRAGAALAGFALALPGLAAPGHARGVSRADLRAEHWRETRQLDDFAAALDAQPSATKALEGWCAKLNGADHAIITAVSVKDADAAVPRDGRALLGAGAGDRLAYRHVRLNCQGWNGQVFTLSEAHNWYRPDLLTPAMNATLADTDTPFGKVVAPLHFTREALASVRGRGPGCPPGTVLTHRARLRLPDGQALAWVVECYQSAVLAPPLRVMPPGPAQAPLPAPVTTPTP